MCYVDEYIHLFQKYYYIMFQQDDPNNLVYNYMLSSKLPNPWGLKL